MMPLSPQMQRRLDLLFKPDTDAGQENQDMALSDTTGGWKASKNTDNASTAGRTPGR
jgi:hypothetical protein